MPCSIDPHASGVLWSASKTQLGSEWFDTSCRNASQKNRSQANGARGHVSLQGFHDWAPTCAEPLTMLFLPACWFVSFCFVWCCFVLFSGRAFYPQILWARWGQPVNLLWFPWFCVLWEQLLGKPELFVFELIVRFMK